MIELIRLVLPYLFILYFVVKGIKEPFYFLGIPFLMFMSESIFFEGVKIFKMPGSLFYALMFIWLVLLWIVSIVITRKEDRDEISNTFRFNILDYFIMGLLVISFAGLTYTLIKYSDIKDVLKEFIALLSLFASYFIIKKWSSQNKPELLVKFLYSLVIINSIASFLFVLHQGLHLNIYHSEEFSAEIFQGEEITRSFWFMPQFLPFSVAFLLVFKDKKYFIFYLLLSVNLLAVFISYTRSSVINSLVIFLLYLLLTGLKKGRIGFVIKNVLLYGIFGVFGLLILSKVFPANAKYLMNRFTELSETSVTSGPNNMQYRFIMTKIIVSDINENMKLFGMGPVTENQDPLVDPMRKSTADLVWTGVIYRWGFVGLVLFICLYIFSLMKGYSYYLESQNELSDLALFFILFIVSQMIESFVSWTFMSGHGFAIGLWYFAMLSALLGFKQDEEVSDVKINYISD